MFVFGVCQHGKFELKTMRTCEKHKIKQKRVYVYIYNYITPLVDEYKLSKIVYDKTTNFTPTCV